MKTPKITNREYAIIFENDTYYHIKYITPYGTGYMNIDTKLYDKIEDRLLKLFKDATIIERTMHRKDKKFKNETSNMFKNIP